MPKNRLPTADHQQFKAESECICSMSDAFPLSKTTSMISARRPVFARPTSSSFLSCSSHSAAQLLLHVAASLSDPSKSLLALSATFHLFHGRSCHQYLSRSRRHHHCPSRCSSPLRRLHPNRRLHRGIPCCCQSVPSKRRTYPAGSSVPLQGQET